MEKALLFLATEKGFRSLQNLIGSGQAGKIGCVVSFSEVNVRHDWSEDLRGLCGDNHIPFFLWKDVSQNLVSLIRDNGITSAFAISWKFLIPLEINRHLQTGLIVFHDSLLPKYRGFTPTVTAILSGDTEVGVTALFAVDEVDRGDIVLQRSLPVPKDMYMREIVSRQADLYADMLPELISSLSEGKPLSSVPQSEQNATYSIWRGPEDYEIDWTLSSDQIFNAVRALGEPYLGAFTWIENQKVIIDQAIPCQDLSFAIRQPGKIWSISDNCPVVVCGSGMLKILSAHGESGEPFLFKKLRVRLGRNANP